jgi:hypothetical protein
MGRMNKYLVAGMMLILVFAISCRKRNDKFAFAGVWEIQKVEMVKYKNGNQVWDTLITDTAGWFAFQLATGLSQSSKMGINYPSMTGLTSSNDVAWEIDEHTGERLIINNARFTRKHIAGGEKWSYMLSDELGNEYWRETLYVKHR